MLSVNIPLRPSRYLLCILLSLHAAAGSIISWLTIPLLLKLYLFALMLFSFIYYCRQLVWRRAPHAIASIGLTAGDPSLILTTRCGMTWVGTVLGNSYISPWLIIINYRLTTLNRGSLVLLPDTVDAEAFRRLRVLLKHGLE